MENQKEIQDLKKFMSLSISMIDHLLRMRQDNDNTKEANGWLRGCNNIIYDAYRNLKEFEKLVQNESSPVTNDL